MTKQKSQKVLLVGGGSGGHLTPLFAVRDAILKQSPTAQIEIWTDRKMLGAAEARAADTRIRTIISGKYRRYVGKKTPAKDRAQNLVDLFRIAFGIIQSFFRLLFSRPNVVFLKGGFASVPAGFAARALRIPYIIHESDSDLGLANRLLARHAKVIATGLPRPKASGDDSRFVYTGIPIDEAWLKPRRLHKSGTSNPGKTGRYSVVILGGGLGAHSLNLEAAKMARYFNESAPTLKSSSSESKKPVSQVKITAFIGRSESKELEQELQELGVETHRFVSNAADIVQIVQSADVVVARAGATTIAELAATSRAVILVAKATLPGGHQERNAAILAKEGAVIDYDGSTLDDGKLPLAVNDLLHDPAKRRSLGAKLHELGRYDAADTLAGILLNLNSAPGASRPHTAKNHATKNRTAPSVSTGKPS